MMNAIYSSPLADHLLIDLQSKEAVLQFCSLYDLHCIVRLFNVRWIRTTNRCLSQHRSADWSYHVCSGTTTV